MSETQGLTEDEVDILVSSAVTAPSMHNTQPWRFDVVGSVVDVILDDERTLPAEDSSGRLIRIGLGAATFNVRVAAAMLGHETTLAIDPDPARPDIVARVFLGQRQGLVELGSLYGELRRRHTYRGPMMENVVAQRVRERITGSVKGEGANLHWLDAGCRHGLRVILREADELDVHDEDRLTEWAGWIGGRRSEDGVLGTEVVIAELVGVQIPVGGLVSRADGGRATGLPTAWAGGLRALRALAVHAPGTCLQRATRI